jgi:hypothetical protein
LRHLGTALGGLLIETINGQPAVGHPASTSFVESGFARTAMGLQLRSGARAARSDGTTIAGNRLGGKLMANRRPRRAATSRCSLPPPSGTRAASPRFP